MWRFLLGVVIVIGLGEAQRSSYAPRPGSNSRLLPRFRKNQTQPSTENTLSVRGGDEESDSEPSSSLPPELQGTLEDLQFVHRVSKWPEERQPFWYKNRHAISSMRGREIDGGNANGGISPAERRPVPRFQSSFIGASNGRRTSGSEMPVDNYGPERDPTSSYLRRLSGGFYY